MLINEGKKAGIEFLKAIDDIYENLEDNNTIRKRKPLKVLKDTKTYMEANRKLSPIVIELFIRGRKINFSLLFKSQWY